MAKICIDPGHYGKYNRCPAIPEYYESEMVWKLSQLQKKYLEQLGHTVIVTRKDPNKDLDLIKRGKTSKGCDLFISNHSNAVGGGMNESTRHVAVYHLVDDKTTDSDDISADFAKKIAPVIANTMGVTYKVLTRKSGEDRNKDGIMNDNYYGVLHGARLVNTPGLILEHSFHTSSETVKWLLKDENLEKLAKAEAECIDAYFRKDSQDIPQDNKPDVNVPTSEFKVKVEITDLNIRKGPGTNYEKTGKFTGKGIFTIVETSSGKGSTAGWGKLKSGSGWISLDFVKRL